jgi:hypothetical protein
MKLTHDELQECFNRAVNKLMEEPDFRKSVYERVAKRVIPLLFTNTEKLLNR